MLLDDVEVLLIIVCVVIGVFAAFALGNVRGYRRALIDCCEPHDWKRLVGNK